MDEHVIKINIRAHFHRLQYTYPNLRNLIQVNCGTDIQSNEKQMKSVVKNEEKKTIEL